MVHPRVALASGFAALAAGALALAGAIDTPVPVVIALILAARAAAPAAAGGPASLARLAASVPAWVGVSIVAVLRAGSVSLADTRGANAVAGLSLFNGSAMIVAACWLAVLAATIASLPLSIVPEHRELDVSAIGVQVALAVTLFAGPQITTWSDAVPWALGVVVMGALVWFGRRLAHWDWIPNAATLCAAIAVGLALAAPRL